MIQEDIIEFNHKRVTYVADPNSFKRKGDKRKKKKRGNILKAPLAPHKE